MTKDKPKCKFCKEPKEAPQHQGRNIYVHNQPADHLFEPDDKIDPTNLVNQSVEHSFTILLNDGTELVVPPGYGADVVQDGRTFKTATLVTPEEMAKRHTLSGSALFVKFLEHK